jgi:hypothetical protein
VVALDHDFDLSRAWREGVCFLRQNQGPDAFASVCDGPPAPSKPRLFLWGDSHAADLYPGLEGRFGGTGPLAIAQYTASACPPIAGLVKADRPFCEDINDLVLRRLKTLRPDTVLLSGDWDAPAANSNPDNGVGFGQQGADALTATIRDIRRAGVRRIVVLGTAPYWPRPAAELLMKGLESHQAYVEAGLLPRRLLQNPGDARLRAAVIAGGGEYVSLIDMFCGPIYCRVATALSWRQLFFSDRAHLTKLGSAFVAGNLSLAPGSERGAVTVSAAN